MSELIKIAARLARREGLPDDTPASVFDWLGAESIAIRTEGDKLRALIEQMENDILGCETGYQITDVLANYRRVRRAIQDRRTHAPLAAAKEQSA